MLDRFSRHLQVVATILTMPLLACSGASAEDAPLRVSVNGTLYRVSGNAVSTDDGGQIDALKSRKASFTAQVLDREILHSDYAARLFSPETRASVLSSVASGRLIEPWRRTLGSPTPNANDLSNAVESFKVWAAKLAADPKQLMLAAVRKTYSDGATAYQENAAIYRSVVKRNETLSYDDAVRFLGNETATRRLAVAFEIEKYLNNASSPQPASTTEGSEDPTKVRRLVQTEVLDKAVAGVKSPEDLWRAYGKITRIAENEQATLRSYLGTVRPAVVRFTFTGNNASEATSRKLDGSIVTKFSGQNAVTITVPVTSPVRPPVNITGGILPPPTDIAAPGQVNRPETNSSKGGNGAGRNNAANGSGPDNNAALGDGSKADSSKTDTKADTSAPADGGDGTLASNSEPRTANPGEIDNLKTYSSKPYHTVDGMVFNPMNGLWENPADASDYRIPTIITCCDDTGLAFPNEAIEAQQEYWWDGGGTNPNCGRLYDCGPSFGKGGITETATTGTPTDRDAEILNAIEYFDQLTPEDRSNVAWEFITNLPSAYRGRALILYRQHQASRATIQHAPGQAGSLGHTVGGYSGRSGGNHSTITGLGGSGGGVASSYSQVTQTTAQTIVGQYKSIPGGVTLEGDSSDLAFIKSIAYLPSANAFLLNNDVVYLNPVSPKDFAQIFRAILADDKMGVSLTSAAAIVYGKLAPESDVAGNMELADRFLGSIAFGNKLFLKNYTFAPNYDPKPRALNANFNYAVYFNLHNLRFQEEVDGHLTREGLSLDTTLVPLLAKPNSDGGHLPDLERIKKGDIPPEYIANLKHLQDNIGYYARERILRKTFAYAEAAAFSRTLKASGLTLNLASLDEGVNAEKPVASAPAAKSNEDCALAAVHWSSTESIGTREAYKDHLARFPTCTFATLAAARIAALDAKVEAPTSPRPPKACGPGQTLNAEGECDREKAQDSAPRRQVRRATTAVPQGRSSGGALDCNGPVGLIGCVGHALNKH